jgi:two-component system, cell cycle sensor histidine kinase and response regulator CckA
MLAIFIVSTWTLAFYSSHMQRKDMQQLLGNQQFSMATFIAQYIIDELDKRINSLEVAASLLSPAVRQGDMEALYKLLEQRPIFQSHFNAGVFITGIEGIAIAEVPLTTGRFGINFSDKDYLIGAFKEGRTTIGKPVLDPLTKAPVFVIAVPIRDANGKLIGALMGVTDLTKSNFLDKIADNRYGKTGGYLLNAPRHRVIIAATDKNRIMQPTPAFGVNPLYDRYTQGFEGFGVATNSFGVEELTAAKRIPVADWLIIVKIPTAEAFAPIYATQLRMLLITSLISLLAGGMTWWMVRRQLAPMLTAVKKLDAQSDSDLPLQPLPLTRQDEVGELIGGFNHLLETLAQREEVVLESQKKLVDIIEFLPDATLAINMKGRVIIWNKAIETMTGISATEMIGKGDHVYTIPFYGKARPQLMDLIFEDREDVASLYPHIIREGDTLITEAFCNALYSDKGAWIFAKASPLKDHAGEIIGAIESIRDITEQKRAEEMLRESEEHLSSIFRSAPIGIGSVVDRQFKKVNSRLCQMTGYNEDELVGQSSRILYPSSEDFEFVGREKYAQIGEHGTGTVETHWQRKDGTIIEVLLSSTPVDMQDHSKGVTFTALDITERKHAQEEKIKLEGQLQQAQKMEAIGQLAGGVAHDFNNMLGVIIGQVDLALDEVASNQPFFNNLEEIRKAARRSADITRQLLAFARKQIIAPKVLDLNETVEGILKLLRRLIGEDIDLAWLPRAGLWPVKVDPSQIDQILANLCVNARDAISDVGKITIETGNSTLDEAYCLGQAGLMPGEYVSISVSDNGSGIDKETLPYIFEPFFTTKGVGEGTGLGLATVYGAVKQNNGFIRAHSKPDQGTTFTIYLPRYQGEAEQMQQEGEAEPNARSNETILLVEDEPAVMEMTKTMLQRQGYTVLAANTPAKAIRQASEFAGEIHLLLTDVIMPEMNGKDLAQSLLVSRPGVKCLFMSGYTSKVIAHHGVLDKGVNFIQKPFSKKDLTGKVHAVLQEVSSRT